MANGLTYQYWRSLVSVRRKCYVSPREPAVLPLGQETEEAYTLEPQTTPKAQSKVATISSVENWNVIQVIRLELLPQKHIKRRTRRLLSPKHSPESYRVNQRYNEWR